MQNGAETVEQYVDFLPEERKQAIGRLRKTILENIPKGFVETMSYGMIGYVIPHSLYPYGYNCDPKLPLPIIHIGSQKNYISLYHMGIYADSKLKEWFIQEYPKHSKTKPDMGKGCIRFKKPDLIPYELIGELAGKINAEQWIEIYESNLKPGASKSK